MIKQWSFNFKFYLILIILVQITTITNAILYIRDAPMIDSVGWNANIQLELMSVACAA